MYPEQVSQRPKRIDWVVAYMDDGADINTGAFAPMERIFNIKNAAQDFINSRPIGSAYLRRTQPASDAEPSPPVEAVDLSLRREDVFALRVRCVEQGARVWRGRMVLSDEDQLMANLWFRLRAECNAALNLDGETAHDFQELCRQEKSGKPIRVHLTAPKDCALRVADFKLMPDCLVIHLAHSLQDSDVEMPLIQIPAP